MNETFAHNFQRIRWRVLAFNLVLLAAGIALTGCLVCLWWGVPVPFDSLIVLVAIILGTHPLLSIMLAIWSKQLNVRHCPNCSRELWQNTGMATGVALRQKCLRCGQSLRWELGFEITPIAQPTAMPEQSTQDPLTPQCESESTDESDCSSSARTSTAAENGIDPHAQE